MLALNINLKKLFITNPTEYVVSIYITEHLPISEKHCIL